MSQHYMTMCFRENTEVTYDIINDEVLVAYEKTTGNELHRAEIKLDGTVISQEGFSQSDMDYFIRFTIQNAPILKKIVDGEL